MADLKIRVGAAIDGSLNAVFRSVADAAKKAGRQVAGESAKAAKDTGAAYRGSTDEAVKAIKAREAAERKALKASASEFEKAERAKVRATEKSARERAAAEKRAAKETERERDRALAGEQKLAAAARRSDKRAFSAVAGAGRTAIGYGMRLAGDIASGLGVQTDVGSALGASAKRETIATQISNAGYLPGQSGPAGTKVDPRALQVDANKVAMDTAMSSEDALKGLSSFVGLTGDLQTGRDILGDMGKLAKATGSSLEDMVDAAAQISNAMGDAPDKGKAIGDAMRVIAGQGQVGAVEIKDMASQMAKLASQANNFKISDDNAKILSAKGVTNSTGQGIAIMGAMAQAARAQGGRSSATTAVQSSMAFVRDLAGHAELKRLTEAGVDVFADKSQTKAKDPKEIIKAILSKTKGNLPELTHLLPNQNSRAVVNAFAQDYRRGADGLTRGKGESADAFEQRRNAEGLKAVSDSFDKFLNVAMDSPEITAKFNAAMNTTESKVQLFNNHMAQSADQMRDALYPALVALTPVVVGLTAGMGEALSTILGLKEQKRQQDVASSDLRGTNAIEQAKGMLRARNPLSAPYADKPENWVDARSGEAPSTPLTTDAAGDMATKLGETKEDIAAKLADLQKQRDNAAMFLPQRMGGSLPDFLAPPGSEGPGMQSKLTEFQSLNSTIERMTDTMNQADQLRGALLTTAFRDALKAGSIKVEIVNMPTITSPGGSMSVNSPTGH